MAQQDSVSPIVQEYAFTMRIESEGLIEFRGPMRSRTFEPTSGGEIWGPKLQGRVVPKSGADYASNEMMDAHMMLQATDGTWIYMNLLGYEHSETDAGDTYFRVAPYFDAPTGPHEWLSRTVFVGIGERHHNPDHMIIHCHAIL
jgi:hypothetical protein